MRRRLQFTPQARRDFQSILAWYTENSGARAATRAGATIRKRLKALGSGRVRGAEASPKQESPYPPRRRAAAHHHFSGEGRSYPDRSNRSWRPRYRIHPR
ncbi:MAG: type II toxin-antitoxin system RelE/ParE family toxin [Proteobacteria bacterium]|nr:type II toxin-antitoxin system RelE/ParE family toxin [Pseudomonadota bacterium]